MTSSEALQQIGLNPDVSHSGTAVEAAINTQMMKAQCALKAAFTARGQEAAMKQLERLQEAANSMREACSLRSRIVHLARGDNR